MNRPVAARELAVALMLAVCLSGCAGPAGQEPHAVRKVLFACDNGETALVRFHTTEELAELLYDGRVTELPQQRTGSGFYYTNGRLGIRGKGDELLLEIGRRAPIRCHATARP